MRFHGDGSNSLVLQKLRNGLFYLEKDRKGGGGDNSLGSIGQRSSILDVSLFTRLRPEVSEKRRRLGKYRARKTLKASHILIWKASNNSDLDSLKQQRSGKHLTTPTFGRHEAATTFR
ncbi:hypothetical protein PUN28_003210 [Cardiocondyla obscurior]|uniref:Uncharacterized protein n=1 Tax=Cardiocondyla obscurior TaxID=286306 RepID=A0AAW2GIJ4_9HYME